MQSQIGAEPEETEPLAMVGSDNPMIKRGRVAGLDSGSVMMTGR